MKSMQILVSVGLVSGLVLVGLTWKSSHPEPSDPDIEVVAWNPPKTSIDPGYVSLAKGLLGNGLGDPRGGRFSRVTVELGNGAWGKRADTEGYGWVLPDGKRAVLMDGLTYPIKDVRGPADLDKFIGGNESRPRMSFQVMGVAQITKSTPALLLLVNRPDLAEKTFNASVGQMADTPGFTFGLWLHQRLQMQVAQSLIDHTDAEGLSWARQMLKVSMVEEKQGVATKFPQNTPMTSDLKTSRAIYQDLVNRVRHPHVAPLDVAALMKLAKDRRMNVEIENLDDVEGRQWSQPGGIDYSQDPLYKAIRAEGTAIVPRLIESLRTDTRYTRSVSFFRDFFPQRSIHSVRDVVKSLLADIWPSSIRWANADAVAMATSLANAWRKEGGLSEPQRWVHVLKDDTADPKSWLEACQYLVSPEHQLGERAWTYPARDAKGPMRGEPLKATRGAEIAELMAKRAMEVSKIHVGNSMDLFSEATALKMGHCLAQWSPKTALKPLRDISQQAMSALTPYGQGFFQHIADPYSVAATDRMLLGDRTAVIDYSRALDMLMPLTSWLPISALKPFWALPRDPDVQGVAAKFLAGQQANLTGADVKTALCTEDFFAEKASHSPILVLQQYRKMLAAGMQNGAVAGEAWAENVGTTLYVRYAFEGGASGSLNTPKPDQPLGKHFKVTVGDYLAQVATRIKGAPEFCLIWAQPRRDQAKHELAQWLLDDRQDWLAVAKSSPFYSEFF